MKVANFWRIFRFGEWNRTIMLVVITGLLILAFNNKLNQDNMHDMALYSLYLILMGMFGFLLNSYADRKADHKVGRKVYIYNYSRRFVIALLAIMAFCVFVFPIVFENLLVFLAGSVLIILTVSYSIRPIRLKERGLSGFVLLVIAMIPLPFSIFIMLFDIGLIEGAIFLGFFLLFSFVDELAQQIEDREHDLRTKTTTWMTQLSKKSQKRLMGLFLFTLLLYPFVFFIFYELPYAFILLVVFGLFNVEIVDDLLSLKS